MYTHTQTHTNLSSILKEEEENVVKLNKRRNICNYSPFLHLP